MTYKTLITFGQKQ